MTASAKKFCCQFSNVVEFLVHWQFQALFILHTMLCLTDQVLLNSAKEHRSFRTVLTGMTTFLELREISKKILFCSVLISADFLFYRKFLKRIISTDCLFSQYFRCTMRTFSHEQISGFFHVHNVFRFAYPEFVLLSRFRFENQQTVESVRLLGTIQYCTQYWQPSNTNFDRFTVHFGLSLCVLCRSAVCIVCIVFFLSAIDSISSSRCKTPHHSSSHRPKISSWNTKRRTSFQKWRFDPIKGKNGEVPRSDRITSHKRFVCFISMRFSTQC